MQCPYCNSEMQDGYISTNGRTSVNWKSSNEQSEPKNIRLSPADFYMIEIDAFYCDSCKKIIVDTKDFKQPVSLGSFFKRIRNKS